MSLRYEPASEPGERCSLAAAPGGGAALPAGSCGAGNPTPYTQTLHPTPYTLHPTPLHPTHYTLNPTPGAGVGVSVLAQHPDRHPRPQHPGCAGGGNNDLGHFGHRARPISRVGSLHDRLLAAAARVLGGPKP